MRIRVAFRENAVKLSVNMKVGVGGSGEAYTGAYEVTPDVVKQVLPTAQKTMSRDVTILEIPFFEVTNNSGGTTVSIVKEIY